MDIYSVLSSKPHNDHYLKRYIRFINGCMEKNQSLSNEETENHHICPRGKHAWSEYRSFRKYPWNKATLTLRQHLLAHALLAKAFPSNYSIVYAYWSVICRSKIKINTIVSESLRNLYSEHCSKRMSMENLNRVKEGRHIFSGGDIQRKSNKQRLDDGIHHCKNGIPCVNKEGEVKFINKDEFYSQEEKDKSKQEWVSTSSNEGRKRRNITSKHHAKNLVQVVDKSGISTSITKEDYSNRKKLKDDTYAQVSSKEGQRRLGKEFSRLLVCVDQNGEKIMLTSEEYDKQKTDEDSTTWLYVISISLEGKRRKNMINE